MQLTITSLDYAPNDLYAQTPFVAELLRELPGPDRPDYWLAALNVPLRWTVDGTERSVFHVVLAARWAGTQIQPGNQHLSVGIAYIIEPSLLSDASVDFQTLRYVAIGNAEDTTGGRQPVPMRHAMAGRVCRHFDLGNPPGTLAT